jgi:prephenate dehydratase
MPQPPLQTAPRTDKIYILGPEGTFSDAAARIYVAHLTAGGLRPPVIVHTTSIEKALANAAVDPVSVAIVPIENSETGTVIVTQEELRSLPLTIEWELSIPVRYNLISRGPLEQVTRIFCHPLAHAQCSRFLNEHVADAAVSFVSSNARAGVELEASSDSELAAALVPSEYASSSRWSVIMKNVQNSAFNTTRFLVMRQRELSRSVDFSRRKTSAAIKPKEDRPGALADLLAAFARCSINIARIESRPSRERVWNYVFFLDFNNNSSVPDALREVALHAEQVLILGTYDSLTPTASG